MGTYVVVGALNAFHILGALFAIWAVSLTALGVRRENFPRTDRQAWLVGATSVLLAAGAISSAIIVGALEGNEKSSGEAAGKPGAQTAPAAGGGELRLAADPSPSRAGGTVADDPGWLDPRSALAAEFAGLGLLRVSRSQPSDLA